MDDSTVVTNTITGDNKPLTLKIRPILVDAHVKDFSLGPAHDVTDHLFVVRRALPCQRQSSPGIHLAPALAMATRGMASRRPPHRPYFPQSIFPELNAVYSVASWYRDYAAYCGVSEDGKKIYAIVAQLNKSKPVLKKSLNGQTIPEDATADSVCPAPAWQRSPARDPSSRQARPKQTFAVRGHTIDLINESEEQEEEEARDGKQTLQRSEAVKV